MQRQQMFSPAMIRTKDGRKIGARIYSGDNCSRVIVIAPSTVASQEIYQDIALFFQQNGFCVLTYDYRGMGDSAPENLANYQAKLGQWAIQDMDAVILYVKNQFPKKELIFIGHGIGGEIIGLAPASQYINRLVLVGSALSCSRLRKWKDRLWIEIMKIFIKFISWIYGYFPGRKIGVMDNIPKGVMDEWIQWCNNANGLFDDFSDHNYRKLQVPLLSFSFTDDWRSQESGVKALLEHFKTACITWYHLKPKQTGLRKIGHTGFFKHSAKNNLWNPLLHWINDENSCKDAHIKNDPGASKIISRPHYHNQHG